MGKLKVALNAAGVRELLKSSEMQDICREHATAARSRCGDGYETDVFVGKNRVNAMVWAESVRAKRENAKHNTLLKALR